VGSASPNTASQAAYYDSGTATWLDWFTGTPSAMTLNTGEAFWFENDDNPSFTHLTVVGLVAQPIETVLTSGWVLFPAGNLTLGKDHNFYGTTCQEDGTVFRVTTNGAVTTLGSFNGTDGEDPQSGLTLGSDGNLYGTTILGGSSGDGTVFRVTTNGVLATLVSFTGTNGGNPFSGLTLGNDGNFYGTTECGGNGYIGGTQFTGYGTVFRVTTNGVLTTLVSFSVANGVHPLGALTLGADGNFYGTASGGGSGDLGTVFRVTTNGVLTPLVAFNGTNGDEPYAGLTLGNDGNFYGTTYFGGNGYDGTTFIGYGTVFRVTTNGVLTTLASFTGTNGANPNALTLGNDGNFYGTTQMGGNLDLINDDGGSGDGTVFQVTTNGALTPLVVFNGTNGDEPYAGLTLGNDGNFYGTTFYGGSNSDQGLIFEVPGPVGISSQPLSQTVPAGGNANFTVSVVGGSPLACQWLFNGTNLGGATSSSLTLSNVSLANQGNYQVVVSDTLYGSVTSSVAGLTVQTDLPWLSWAVSGNILLLSWPQNNSFDWLLQSATNLNGPWIVVASGVTSGGVDIVSLPINQSLPACYFRLATGGAYSANLIGYVNTPVSAGSPNQVTVPFLDFYTGNYLIGSVIPYATDGAYVWVGTSNPNNASDGAYYDGSSGTWLDWNTWDPSALVLNPGQTFWFENDDDPAFTNLFFIGQVIVQGTPPSIATQPLSQTVVAGTNVTLSVVAGGSGPFSYQWDWDGTGITGATNSLYTINHIQTSQAGNYSVVVANAYGSVTSSVAMVTVTVAPTTPNITWANPLAITYGTALGANQLNATASVPGSFGYTPAAGTVLNAGTNTLTVVFTPTDTTDYTSATGSVSLVALPAPLIVTANSASRVYGQVNPTFTGSLSGVVNGDNITAAYACGATTNSLPGAYPIVPALMDPNHRLGNYSVTTHNGTLTVTAGPPPILASISPNTGLTNGGTAVTITGSGFEPGAGVSFGGQSAGNIVVLSGTQITAVTPPGLPGLVNVVLGNPDGNAATLTNGYLYTSPAPMILTQPAGESVVLGSNAVFSVSARYAAGYQWQFDGANLTHNGRITGSHGNVLTIPAVQYTDEGVYQVLVTNAWGSVESTPVSLLITVPPSIGTSPKSQTVGIGGTVTFSVGVGGTAPFAYQWLLGGLPLAGATNATLTLASVPAGDQGQQYSVVVGNPAGSATSAAATLTVLNYCASVQPGQAVYPMGSPVPLTVQTFNCSSSAAVPNASATVWISGAGTTRSLAATTGAGGSTTLNFVPLATEYGAYQVAATLPGQSIPAAQGTFSLVGLSPGQNSLSPVLTPGLPVTNTLSLNNLTGVALTGITPGIVGTHPDVQATVNAAATLAGNATSTLTLVLLAPGNTPAQDQFYLQITTAQGTTNLVLVTATVVPPTPQLTATPASLKASMVAGGQTLVNFNVVNTGGAASGPVQVLLPSTTWLTTVTPLPIPPLAPGQTNQVTLALTPPLNLPLGAYTGTVELVSSNAAAAVPFQFDCISDLTGALQVTVQDELSIYGAGSPNVSNATVTVTDFLTGSPVTNAVTDESGIVLFTNLTSAYYNVAVTAPDHGGFNTTLLLAASQTNNLTAFLNLDLVSYTWIVTPTVIPDHYTFTLQTTFATQVPWPVVTVSPGAIDLCTMAGQTNEVNLTITNSGLIAAQGLNLYFGAHPDWLIQPLVTSLGDLPPQASRIVPVLIVSQGSATGVPDSITAQLSYRVTTPTQTNSTIVPIYLYDANPADCEPQNPTPAPVAATCATCGVVVGGGAGGGSGGSSGSGGSGAGAAAPTIQLPNYTLQSPQSALVQVALQIHQNAVISRDAFNASLQLVNNAGAAVSDLSVNLTVYDASNNVANRLFGIPAPTLSGLNAVDGTGVLANGATGSAVWTIVPATNAAPANATPFFVGGSFSYLLNGEPVTVPLFPVPITVLPTPIFNVDYFLQHDVYAQDPLTNIVYPSVPFALGLLVHNTGFGEANDFTLTSAQPQIIQNSNDLLIAFQLTGSQAGTNQSVSPSFTLDFGDLGPQSTADGLWYLTSTLEGEFTSFAASFQHTDALGNTNTSLISRVRLHELNHVVLLTQPTDDGLPDYLVNDTTNVDALPNLIYSSDGTTDPVTSLTNGVAAGIPSPGHSSITVTVPATPGWGYFEIIDPGNGNYTITSVTRSDGGQLLLGSNVWQTPARLHMMPPKPNNLIHLFDYNATGSYTVTYGVASLAATATTLNPMTASTYAQTVTLAATVNPPPPGGTVQFYDNGTALGGPVSVNTNNGLAQFSTSALTAGIHPITATFSGTASYAGSTSGALGQTVNLATPAITTAPTASAITYGQTLASSILSGGVASVPGGYREPAPPPKA
jgi:uncharacterized repeat protein (TIGR03803 family)